MTTISKNTEHLFEGAQTETELALRLTNTLLRAVATGDPIRSLVTQLATLTHGAAIVYDSDGNVIERAGEAPAQLIWNEAASLSSPDTDVTIGRWRVITRRVALSSETHILAIASRTHTLIGDVQGELLLETAERLLSTIHGLQYSAQLRERRDNQRVLMTLQDGIPPSREHRFWGRLEQFGFKNYVELCAFELIPKTGEAADETDVQKVITLTRGNDVPLLVGLRRVDAREAASITGVFQKGGREQAVLDALEPLYNIGVSESFNTLVHLPEAKRSAEIALAIAVRRSREGAPGVIVKMGEIDLSTWLLSRVSLRTLKAEVTRTIGELMRNEQLLETLVTFLASGSNVAQTAKQLYLHENTVRYRISKVEEELQVRLSDPIALSNITLALYEDILESQRVMASQP